MSHLKNHRNIATAALAIIAALVIGFVLGFTVSNAPRVPMLDLYPINKRAPTGSAVVYAKMEALRLVDGSRIADIRLVEWVPDSDNQEQAALEMDDCSLDEIEKEMCLSNPFYIRDTEKRLSLPFAPDVRIRLFFPDRSGSPALRDITPMEFREMHNKSPTKTTPYIITTTNGMISDIEQQYTP
jgi:hypothetical protein